MARGHGHRRAEARRALEEGAEGEGDQQQLQPPVRVTPAMESCSTLNEPFRSVSWCRKMMFRTIQPIGSRPVSAPSHAALPAMPGALNPARRAELGALLHGLLNQGRTLVVATHDEEFAREFATRVLRVDEGAITT